MFGRCLIWARQTPKVSEVLARVENLMRGNLGKVDYQTLSDGRTIRWRNTAQWERRSYYGVLSTHAKLRNRVVETAGPSGAVALRLWEAARRMGITPLSPEEEFEFNQDPPREDEFDFDQQTEWDNDTGV